jgi:Gpi18-like mannosyltransferase
VTSTLVHGVGRSPGESNRALRAFAASPALFVLLLAGFSLRLTIAYVLFPASGFETDLSSYASWALTMGAHGPAGFYANAGFSDYPPAYLYLLWPIGLLAGGRADATDVAMSLVKLPPMLIDLAVGYVIYRLVLGWAWPGRRAEAMALAAGALYVFNPVSLYDSALWGQSDAAGALVVLLGVAALVRGNSEGAAALGVLAALVKPQFGVLLLPLVAAVLLKRHLWRPGSGPHHRPWAPQPLAAWLADHRGPVRLLTAFLAAAAVFFAVSLPFGMGPLELVQRMIDTAGGYEYLSVNAYNLWALVGSAEAPSLAASGGWSDDTVALWGPLPGVVVGAALLAAGFLWGTLRAALRDDRWTLLAAAAFLAIAFFILPTRVHERYLFPAIALVPLLAAASGRWLVALVLLSLGSLMNLHAILTHPVYGTENVVALPLGETLRSEPWVLASALLQTGVGLWAAWQLRPSLRTSPDGFERAAAHGGRVALDRAQDASPGPILPETTWTRPASLLDRLMTRISRPAIRADRSARLLGEPGGRIDRIDLLVVAGLVLAALVVRGYRLDQPVGMYFDEVYHARTATEFLQHWEYGEPHAIYEFTHPHLAKYAMAWGIRLAGGNEVTGTADLGAPVVDAVIERRWSDPEATGAARGDRLYVATGEALRIHDLATRALIREVPLPAQALALDEAGHSLYLADPTGSLYRLDTRSLDPAGPGADGTGLEAFSAGPGAPVDRLLVTDASLVTFGRGSMSTFDRTTGSPLSERFAFASSDAVALPAVDRIVVDTRELDDRGQAARRLARALAGGADPADGGEDDTAVTAEEQRIRDLLDADGHVVVDAYLADDQLGRVREAIDDGELEAVRVERAPLLAVAGHDGVSIVDAWTLDPITEIPTDAKVTALLLVDEGLSESTLYAATDASLEIVALTDTGPGLPTRLPMPGAIDDLAWNVPATLVHALGRSPQGGPTVYVVEPHGNAVFIDVPLPMEARSILADVQPERPADDRGELLAIGADGRLASVGIDGNAFGWRLPGVLLGALLAGLLYLLARLLFARRSIAVIAAILVVAEGMLFANARIGMNDVYVTTFLVAAALLFAPLYLRPRRPWTAVGVLLGASICLGLALASKWVALYAIGGLVLLVLLRSALGRVVALLGMVGLTAVLGAMAVRPTAAEDPARNWLFLLLMLALTAVLAAGIIRRPLPFTRGEVWLAALGPLVIGASLMAAGLLAAAPGAAGLLEAAAADPWPQRLQLAGGAAILLGLAVSGVAWVTARRRGPFAREVPEPSAWLHPGRLAGMPWLVTLACLTLVPIGIYIVSYAPWIELGNQWGLPLIGSLPFLPDGSATGRTLADLTVSIYQYHDNLRAEHAAASPWWAWPLDLKPVWWFSRDYAGRTMGLIYDAGNLVIFWCGVAAMAFAGWAAWHRRSRSLAIIVILWLCLWLPWARIDRAAFQYHVFASLPFMVMALAYSLAELWHGPSARIWLVARVTGALVILGVPLLWLLRTPLCILAGTAAAHPAGVACATSVTRTAQVSEAGMAALAVLGVGTTFAALLAWRWRRARTRRGGRTAADTGPLAAMVIVVALTLAGIIATLSFLDSSRTVALSLSSDVIALAGLALLAVPAWLLLRASDPRRVVLATLGAAALWLLVWYPNLSGLPLPSDLAPLYQGLLPTWNWDFQFAVNTDPALEGRTIDLDTLIVGLVALGLAGIAAVTARRWRATRSAVDAAAGAMGSPALGGTPPP